VNCSEGDTCCAFDGVWVVCVLSVRLLKTGAVGLSGLSGGALWAVQKGLLQLKIR